LEWLGHAGDMIYLVIDQYPELFVNMHRYFIGICKINTTNPKRIELVVVPCLLNLNLVPFEELKRFHCSAVVIGKCYNICI